MHQASVFTTNIGNTHTASTFYDGNKKKWSKIYKTVTKTHATKQSYCNYIKKIPLKYFENAHAIIVSSVVPSKTKLFIQAVKQNTNKLILLVDNTIKIPLHTVPTEMGADLIANAVSASSKSKPHASICVDFGTALSITTTHVFAKKYSKVAGVSIAPGLQVGLSALLEHGDKLHATENILQLTKYSSPLGKNTCKAINGGWVLGYTYLVSGLVNRIKQELNTKTVVFATGGLSSFIAKECNVFDDINEYHTFDGLKIIAEYNM